MVTSAKGLGQKSSTETKIWILKLEYPWTTDFQDLLKKFAHFVSCSMYYSKPEWTSLKGLIYQRLVSMSKQFKIIKFSNYDST